MSVWVITDLLNHPPHSSGEDRVDRGNAIDSPRPGRGRDLCPLRNFLYGHLRLRPVVAVIATGNDIMQCTPRSGECQKRKRGLDGLSIRPIRREVLALHSPIGAAQRGTTEDTSVVPSACYYELLLKVNANCVSIFWRTFSGQVDTQAVWTLLK
jgi:hypothetical protein